MLISILPSRTFEQPPGISYLSRYLSHHYSRSHCRQSLTRLRSLSLTSLIPLWPPKRLVRADSIQQVSDSPPATVQDMGVNHCSVSIGVPERLLNGADTATIFQRLAGKGMAQRMTPARLENTTYAARRADITRRPLCGSYGTSELFFEHPSCPISSPTDLSFGRPAASSCAFPSLRTRAAWL